MYKIYNSVRSDSPWEIYFNESDELPYAPIGSTAYNVDTGVTMINDGNGWIEKIEIGTGSGVKINNQDKTITENGTYTADEGFTGLGNVTVSVAATGDGWEQLDAMIDGSITEVSSNATSIYSYAFYNYKSLRTADFPLVTSIANYAFHNCNSLTTADFTLITSIGKYAFDKCESLTTLMLRKTEIVCTLLNTSALTSTPIASGIGYIYVPSALIEDYKAGTNWSTYASQFRALEDYTVDGTVTGELDENKI